MEHYKKYIIYEYLLNVKYQYYGTLQKVHYLRMFNKYKYQYYGTLQTVDYLRMLTKYKISVLCSITKSLEIQNRSIETRHR